MTKISIPRTSRRTLLASLCAAGTTAVLPGCRSDAGEADTDEPTEAARPGGTAVIASGAEPQLEVPLAYRAGNFPWLLQVYEQLTRKDVQTHEPQPVLATEWQVSDDGLSMEIRLRDDVEFHTGRPMTAEDVIFTFEQVTQPESLSVLGFIVEQITDMRPDGDHGLALEFASPLSNIFDLFELTPIVDKETWEGVQDATEFVGTGPFVWSEWRPGAEIVLQRYENYRDGERPYLDSIEIPIFSDSTAQMSALRSGRAHLTNYGLTVSDALSFEGDDQYVVDESVLTWHLIGLNVNVPPFDDPKVRQAVGYAIDRERINDQVFGGRGELSRLFWELDEELADSYPYDPDLAAEMIEEAGAVGAEVPLLTSQVRPVSMAEIIRNNLEAVGLSASVESIDDVEFSNRHGEGDLGAAFQLLSGQAGFSPATLLDSAPFLREGNPSELWTEEYRALRADVMEAATEEESADAVARLSEYLLDEAHLHVASEAVELPVRSAALEGVGYTVLGYHVLVDAHLVE